MNEIPLVDLKISYQSMKKEIDESLYKVILKTDFIMGEEIKEFEMAFAEFTDSKFAVSVSSGTDAVHIACKAVGIGKGNEVIVPSHTFTATAEPIFWLGGKVVFA